MGWWEQTSAITKRVKNPTYTLMVSRLTDHKEANNPSHSERPCPFQQLGDQESLKTAGHLLSKKRHLGIPESTCGVGVGCPVEQKDVPSNSRGPTGFGCPTLSQQGLTLSRRDQNNGTWLRASSVPSNSLGVGVCVPHSNPTTRPDSGGRHSGSASGGERFPPDVHLPRSQSYESLR